MKTLNEKLDQIARAEREREQEERGGLPGWLGTAVARAGDGALSGLLGCADEQQLILITVICAAVHNDA